MEAPPEDSLLLRLFCLRSCFLFCHSEVVRKGDELDFSVGFTSTSFPLDNFFVSPRCGCRLNCNDEDNNEFRVRKLKLRISCRQGAVSLWMLCCLQLNSVMLEVGKGSSKLNGSQTKDENYCLLDFTFRTNE
ncbi:hypothetical protein Ahy_B08g093778 [Arachis hypogaea]|uniref:Uncharacterized protein n=1 Tax=Arachis hypogaea TaxID=3818 RepID=A0A444Y6W0_ARAHY|nr:hypothetical protein Ahy_B08g093778 [Arachis hypogaea]